MYKIDYSKLEYFSLQRDSFIYKLDRGVWLTFSLDDLHYTGVMMFFPGNINYYEKLAETKLLELYKKGLLIYD